MEWGRRTLLRGLAGLSVCSLAGCSELSMRDPPGGSVQFINNDGVPHEFTLHVIGVGADENRRNDTVEGAVSVPDEQRTLSLSETVKAGGKKTYQRVFTESVYYELEIRIDGDRPEPYENYWNTIYHPTFEGDQSGPAWNYLIFKVDTEGGLHKMRNVTNDDGPFS